MPAVPAYGTLPDHVCVPLTLLVAEADTLAPLTDTPLSSTIDTRMSSGLLPPLFFSGETLTTRREGVRVGVAVNVRVAVLVGVEVGVRLGVPVEVEVSVMVGVGVMVGVDVRVGVSVIVGVL